MRVCITGAAGFIGAHLAQSLVKHGHTINWAVDSFAPAYGGAWCQGRIASLIPSVQVERHDLIDVSPDALAERIHDADVVIHLAAFAGVRQGELQPHHYMSNNVLSTSAVLSASMLARPRAVLIASSSSVYGDLGTYGACSEEMATGLQPKSHYALTKWINELQLRDFSRMSGIRAIALRFFTVYGAWGRPDMAYTNFYRSLVKAEEIALYGETGGTRNFTHVSDTSEIVRRIAENVVHDSQGFKGVAALNVAAGQPITTFQFLQTLARVVGTPARITHIQRPVVDANATFADTTQLEALIGKVDPKSLDEGLSEFAEWAIRHL